MATICRTIRELAQENGENPPGYPTVHNVIRKLPADLMLLAQEGTKSYSGSSGKTEKIAH